MRGRVTALCLVGLLAASCVGADDGAGGLGLRVEALEGGLPADITAVRATWTVGEGPSEARQVKVAELEVAGARRRLALEPIPAETPLRVRIEGLTKTGAVGYVGSVGPLSLGRYESLHVTVRLVPRSVSTALPGAVPAPRFLHTATRLEDGRVLIAGGFGAAKETSCPAPLTGSSECYELTALDDAWVFDPSSLTFAQIEGGMLEARGGHTATLLDDGEVLVAGGAKHATLFLVAREGAFEPSFRAVDELGTDSALSSFELFDARPSSQATQRDIARGRFAGPPAAPTQVGELEQARFLHAAAANPLAPSRVLLAGGLGRAASSYEVFDAARRGGPGIAPASLNALPFPRAWPTALALEAGEAGWVWLFGGRTARSNDELADRWVGNASDVVGVVASGTVSAFPNTGGASDLPRPEYALFRPVAIAITGGTHALVTGGLGPRCDADDKPAFALSPDALPCTDASTLRTAFVMEADTGDTAALALPSAHVLGAGAALPDGRGVLSGGFSSLSLTTSADVHLIRAPASGAPESHKLQSARALHTTTALEQGGLLSVGGVAHQGSKLVLVTGAELLWP